MFPTYNYSIQVYLVAARFPLSYTFRFVCLLPVFTVMRKFEIPCLL